MLHNKNTYLFQNIFAARSGTLDIKIWNSWNQTNLLCVICGKYKENIKHFMTCRAYGKESLEINWREIYGAMC